jgi:predicted RND superfamily exporter protein
MLFTSLTTLTGFLSLVTTGIPPVAVFGIAVAFGVAVAWLMSMLFIPAYTTFLSDEALQKFIKNGEKKSAVIEVVQIFKRAAWNHPKTIVAIAIVLIISAALGLPKIIVNDNSVRWFKEGHFIRTADVAFNKKLAGAYKANLIFTVPAEVRPDLATTKKVDSNEEEDEFAQEVEEVNYPSVRDAKVISYIEKLEHFLQNLKEEDNAPMVGGTIAVTDVLRKIGKTIKVPGLPSTRKQISQYIFLFENGDLKRGRDLWKIINQDSNSRETLMRVFFKTGDNNHFAKVAKLTKQFIKDNPPPKFRAENGKEYPLQVRWSGLLKVNNDWQDIMVTGMMVSFLESFGIVFLMMVFLFKSLRWGIISMLPLTVTISFLYGMIGHLGIFYNLPIAVLSSLSLGLAIDFAIHYDTKRL